MRTFSIRTMKNINCKAVRRELDESLPFENFSAALRDHLQGCADCRDLHQRQMRLQQIVGSLETVAAPGDFDFRLRARLADARPAPSSWFRTSSVLGIAAILVLVIAAFIGFEFMRPGVRPTTQASTQRESSPPIENNVLATAQPAESQPNHSESPAKHTSKEKISERPSITPRIQKRPQAVLEFSSEGAKHITQSSNQIGEWLAFPIDAPSQALRLSLDDSRGNARTISFPTVSFGSQRVLTNNTSQLAPKGVW